MAAFGTIENGGFGTLENGGFWKNGKWWLLEQSKMVAFGTIEIIGVCATALQRATAVTTLSPRCRENHLHSLRCRENQLPGTFEILSEGVCYLICYLLSV